MKNGLKKVHISKFKTWSVSKQSDFLHRKILDAANNNKKGKIKKRSRRLTKPIREMIKVKKLIWRKLQQGTAEQGEEILYARMKVDIIDGIYQGIHKNKSRKRMELVLKDPSRSKFWRL